MKVKRLRRLGTKEYHPDHLRNGTARRLMTKIWHLLIKSTD